MAVSVKIGHNSNINKNVIKPKNNICFCCNKQFFKLLNISSCKHSHIIFMLVDFKVEIEECRVCTLCHNMLLKIEKFKLMIETSFALNDNEKETKIISDNKLLDLYISPIEIIWTSLNNSLEYDIVRPDSPKDDLCNVGIKKEDDVELNNETQMTDAIDKTTSLDLSKISYPDKIKQVTISLEDVGKERLIELHNKNYLILPYKCSYCITGFHLEEGLKNHIERKHKMCDHGYLCEICKSVLCSEASYKEHCRRHYTRYECLECNKRYKTLYAAIDHYNMVHGSIEVSYECDLCDFKTPLNRRYRYHRLKHQKKHKCSTCLKVFVTQSSLKTHIRYKHEKAKRVYPCNECEKTYSTLAAVNHHRESVHGREMFYCEKCKKYFKTRILLSVHYKQNSNHVTEEDKKYVCSTCGQRFVKKVLLEQHISYDHLNIIQHKCDVCSKSFKFARGLKRHVSDVHRKVEKPRDKICDHCGKGFTTFSILKTHIRTHTGERPLRCEHCSADFAHPGALYTHKKLVHKNNDDS